MEHLGSRFAQESSLVECLFFIIFVIIRIEGHTKKLSLHQCFHVIFNIWKEILSHVKFSLFKCRRRIDDLLLPYLLQIHCCKFFLRLVLLFICFFPPYFCYCFHSSLAESWLAADRIYQYKWRQKLPEIVGICQNKFST